jgi:AcrR family transcriptional regulator
MANPGGLRELKKHRTHDAIVRAAMKLFAKRGFDATTVADIAEAVEIAPRTFFGYFASKEDVVFHDFEDSLAAFSARLRAREAGEDALGAMRAWILEHHGGAHPDAEQDRVRRRIVAETPALSARERANAARFEAALAEAVAADLGLPADSLRPHLVGAAAIAALEALSRRVDP